MPVPNPSDWRVPAHIESRVVGTPKNPSQAGRPKVKRIPSGAHMPQKEVPTKEVPTKDVPSKEVPTNEAIPTKGDRMCSRCHHKGHYSTTCEAFI